MEDLRRDVDESATVGIQQSQYITRLRRRNTRHRKANFLDSHRRAHGQSLQGRGTLARTVSSFDFIIQQILTLDHNSTLTFESGTVTGTIRVFAISNARPEDVPPGCEYGPTIPEPMSSDRKLPSATSPAEMV